METKKNYDTIIIGGGPSGCTAAALLSEYGLRVLVLEREKFPRYHIGESMIPFTHYPLKRLGLLDKMNKSAFVNKHSVQFVSMSGKASQPFYFATRYPAEVAQTWQVLRSEFDMMLMDNAKAKGAEVIEEATVQSLIQEDGRTLGVKAVVKTGETVEFRAPMTVDCSGREAIASVHNNWRVRDPKLNKVAVWTYYRGARRDAGIDAGATTVAYVPEKGWFWYIPQHNDKISVGVVAEGKYLTRDGVRDPKGIFTREIEQNAWIKDHIACGVQEGEYRLTSEYSFRSRYSASDGLLLAGDSFGFLDPVFSSGLMFALKSGVVAADAINAAHIARDFSAERFAEYSLIMRTGLENMRKLVYAFYDPKFSFRELTNKYPDLTGDITDCLSGDVNKDFSRLYAAAAGIWRSARATPLRRSHAPQVLVVAGRLMSPSMSNAMPYEFKAIRRVEFAETDMAGIMHFSNFFRFMETAEHAFFRSLGYSVVLSRSGLQLCLPRVHASCDYRSPLFFEDEVLVRLLVEKKSSRSLAYQFRFSRVNESLENARGRLVVACAEKQQDGSLKAVALPGDIASKIQQAPQALLNE